MQRYGQETCSCGSLQTEYVLRLLFLAIGCAGPATVEHGSYCSDYRRNLCMNCIHSTAQKPATASNTFYKMYRTARFCNALSYISASSPPYDTLMLCRRQQTTSVMSRAQLMTLALCLGLCSQAAHGWIHNRARGQVQLPSSGNRHLKSTHPHTSGTGIAHQEAYHSR